MILSSWGWMERHNIIKQLHDDIFPQKEVGTKILWYFVKKFTIHNLNAPHKWQILESKDNYAHTIRCPTEHNQGFCNVMGLEGCAFLKFWWAMRMGLHGPSPNIIKLKEGPTLLSMTLLLYGIRYINTPLQHTCFN